ncbi:hypothetical protein KUBF_48120 [Bacteroides finegoldii]|nr:hypothetical protein KUBF_48120 [Bacteroides finegoldii]
MISRWSIFDWDTYKSEGHEDPYTDREHVSMQQLCIMDVNGKENNSDLCRGSDGFVEFTQVVVLMLTLVQGII